MADAMDRVQERVQEELARHLHNALNRPVQISEFFCLACGEAIPEARRRAVQGVTRCVTCQDISELKRTHYNDGAV